MESGGFNLAMWGGGLQCCAVEEIIDLAGDETPQKSMKNLFNQYMKYGKNPEKRIPAFFVFTGIIKFDRKNETAQERQYRIEDGYEIDNRVDYAQAFASLIKKAKLGRVTTLPAEWNRVNHPDHKVKVYLWRPDPIKLVAWLRENK